MVHRSAAKPSEACLDHAACARRESEALRLRCMRLRDQAVDVRRERSRLMGLSIDAVWRAEEEREAREGR